MRHRARTLVCAALASALGASACGSRGADKPRLKIAAAASLTLAFEAVAEAFTADTGVEVTLSLGASGALATQIINGAPMDLFASADMANLHKAAAAGALDADSMTTYARGRVALWTPADAAVPAPDQLAGLADPRYRKIGLANPETAPYGAAARQALQRAGVWDAVASRVVYGNNVRQAMQFAETGNAGASLVALSLVLDAGGVRVLVDERLHDPLEQGIAVCARSGRKAEARAFIAFLASPKGIEILQRHGLLQPGAALSASP